MDTFGGQYWVYHKSLIETAFPYIMNADNS